MGSSKIRPVTFCALLLACSLLRAPLVHSAQVYSDRVAAVVNGDVILESELKEQKHPFVRKNFTLPLGVVPPGKWPTEKEILDELIVVHLLEQEASKKGIQLNDHGLDAAIDSLRKRNNLSSEKFVLFLGANGLNYADYRKMLRRQIVLSQLVNREMIQRASVSEKEAQQYFKNNEGKIEQQHKQLLEKLTAKAVPEEEETKPEVPTHKDVYVGGKLRLQQIVLKVSGARGNKDKDRVMQTLQKIYSEMKAGADFSRVAKQYSQDTTASKGGDLGFMDYKDMHPSMQKIVEQMKVGDIAPPLTAKNSVIILHLAEGKNRKLKKVPIPAKERKQMEKQIDEMWEKRKAQQQQQKPSAQEKKPAKESAAEREKDSSGGRKAKAEKDLGILTAEEKKEYDQVRDRVMDILRAERIQSVMKEWIDELKKNSIIEVKL